MALAAVVKVGRRAFETGEYSDMRVVDRDGTVYNVHRLILCNQSPWFQAAMKEGRFKEGQDKTIEFPEDEPHVVKAMLEFLYTESYAYPSHIETVENAALFDISVFTMADKYMITPHDKSLTRAASQSYIELLDDDCCEEHVVEKASPNVLRAVYEATKEDDTWLRPFFVDYVVEHLSQLLEDPEFREEMNGTPDFIQELSSRQAEEIEDLRERYKQERERSTTYVCPMCYKLVTMELVDKRKPGGKQRWSYCPACGGSLTNRRWKVQSTKELWKPF